MTAISQWMAVMGIVGLVLAAMVSGQATSSAPSSMPTEHQRMLQQEYAKFWEQRAGVSMKPPPASAAETGIPKNKGFSPKQLKMRRNPDNSTVPLNEQVLIPQGTFWFGSQLDIKGKIAPATFKDGAEPRKKASVKAYYIDVDCVTNEQFADFVLSTHYITEAELFRWSFVVEGQTSERVRQLVDAEGGMGRVKTAKHWMGVVEACWMRPYGFDSNIENAMQYPVVHASFNDAVEYCAWTGRRLPTEKEWEYAARGGRVNESYPWGNRFEPKRMNIWDGDDFPKNNKMVDGYHGPAPVRTYPPNNYGVYNMLGNVWEWVKGGSDQKRILRGGSFIDSADGKFNHVVMVSTRQLNSGDSSASNLGFRCASEYVPKKPLDDEQSHDDSSSDRSGIGSGRIEPEL